MTILFIIWAILGSGLIVLGIWQAGKTIQIGISHIRRLHQVLCSCRVYFTGDYRLKCIVHPLTVLSQKSINCRDFEPILLGQRSQKSLFTQHFKTYFSTQNLKLH